MSIYNRKIREYKIRLIIVPLRVGLSHTARSDHVCGVHRGSYDTLNLFSYHHWIVKRKKNPLSRGFLVGAQRIELWTSFLSGKRSTTELRTLCHFVFAVKFGGAEGNRTLVWRFCRPPRYLFATAPTWVIVSYFLKLK